jgi:hypothetical protein
MNELEPTDNPQHVKWGIFYYNRDDRKARSILFYSDHWRNYLANEKIRLVSTLMLINGA